MNVYKALFRSLAVFLSIFSILFMLTACGGGGGGGGGDTALKVTGEAGPNGSITPTTQDVDSGNTATLTVKPDTGYKINSVTGCNGKLVGDTYTTAAITSSCTVRATFAAISLGQNFVASDDGSFSFSIPDSNVVLIGVVTPIGGGIKSSEFKQLAASDGLEIQGIPGAVIEVRGERDSTIRGLSTLTVKIRAPGYSTFFRSFENVSGTLHINAELAESSGLQEIDIASLETSSLVRAGRSVGLKQIESDEQVTIQMFKNGKTGKKRARVLRSSGGESAPLDPAEVLLVDYSFPLKGLRTAESSTRLLAEVAYIDSPSSPDVMPGGFIAEPQGETEMDIMVTCGASQIELYDDAGNLLLTDPSDRSTDVTLRMLVPIEAYAGLVDDEPEITTSVSVPYLYFDEALSKWILHRDANGAPKYSHLQDQFGNKLTPNDLHLLKHTRDVSYDANGNKRIDPETGLEMESKIEFDPRYAPPGVDPKQVRIYSVNKVHHFTAWNADYLYRTSSYNFDITDKSGRKVNPPVRVRKRSGGSTSSNCRPVNGRCNVHVDPSKSRYADSLIKKYLDRALTPKERREFFERLKRIEDPSSWNAFIEALRNYGGNLKADIAADDSGGDLGRGIRAIFSNATINDSVINTPEGIDCAKSPDICRSIISAAGEQVSKSTSAQKATAFLMEIAVDAYNPSKIADVGYFVDKGIGMLDITMEMDGVATDMKGVYDNYQKVKKAAQLVKASMYLYEGKWVVRDRDFEQYWNASKTMTEGLQAMQDLASTAGDKTSFFGFRTARDRARIGALSAPEYSEQAVIDTDRALMREVENFGGLWFGANKFAYQGYQWGMFVPYERGNPNYGKPVEFSPQSPPLYFGPTGGNVSYLEYFNGAYWVPFEELSDTGVDPLFLPNPLTSSWKNGTETEPMIYLGTFQIDVDLDVSVTGRVVNQNQNPIEGLEVNIGGSIVKTNSDGFFTSATDSLGSGVMVSFGNWSKYFRIDKENKAIDVGEVRLNQGIHWGDTPYSVDGISIKESERQATVAIKGTPYYGSEAVFYRYRLDRTFYPYAEVAPLVQGEIETKGSFDFTFDLAEYLPRLGDKAFSGRYYLRVEAFTSDRINDERPTSSRAIAFEVTNHKPEISDVAFVSETGKLGDVIEVSATATDPDGINDLRSLYASLRCVGDDGRNYSVWGRANGDENIPDTVNGSVITQSGTRTSHWVFDTNNNSRMWVAEAETFDCTLQVDAQDRGWLSARETKQLSLAQHNIAPDVRYSYLKEDYVVTHNTELRPSQLSYFVDKNDDIVSYEVNCGYDLEGNPALGEDAVRVTSSKPINSIGDDPTSYGAGCRYEVYAKDPLTGRYDTSVPGPMSGKEFTYTYTATDSIGQSKTATATIQVLMPLQVKLVNEDDSPLLEKVERPRMCSQTELETEDPTVCNEAGERLLCNENDECAPIMQVFELPTTLPSAANASKKVKVVAFSGNEDGVVDDLRYSVYYTPARNGWWSQYVLAEKAPDQEGVVEFELNRPGTYSINLTAYEYKKDSETGLKTGYYRFGTHYSRDIKVNSTFDVEITVDGLYPEAFYQAGSRLVADVPAQFSAETLDQPDVADWTPNYKWRLLNYTGIAEGEAPVETQPCATKICDLTFDSVGSYSVILEVYNEQDPVDDSGARPTVVKETEFKVFAKPAVTIGNDYTPRIFGEVTQGDRYNTTASFADDQVQRTQWIVQVWTDSDGWVRSRGHSVISSSKNNLEVVFNQRGKYRIVTVVTSVDGVTVSLPGDDIVVTLYQPELMTFEADKMEVSPGGTIEFTASGNDPDARPDDRLGFEWLLDDALIRSTTSDQPVGPNKTGFGALSWTFPASQGERDYKIGVRVVDATGLRSSPSHMTVKTLFKGPSELSIVTTPSSARGKKPLLVDFTADVVKGDGDITKYEWKYDTSAQAVDSGTMPTWSYTYTEPGEYTASVTVTDSNGKQIEAQVTINVIDFTGPSDVSITTTPEEAKGDIPFTVAFSAEATQGDGDLVNYEWQAMDSAEWVSTQTTPSWSYTYTERGNYVARLRVTDSNGKVSPVAVKAITAIDPSVQETVTFTFRERRQNGLGPEYLYPTESGEMQHHEMGAPDFVHVPMEDGQLNWLEKSVNKVETTSLTYQQFGLFGMSRDIWGDISESLFMIDAAGNYDIGVDVFEEHYYDEPNFEPETVSVDFKNVEDDYTCGYLAYGNFYNELYGSDPLTVEKLYTSPSDLGIDDTLQVLALLGTGKTSWEGTCTIDYAGYVSGVEKTLLLPAQKLAMRSFEVSFPQMPSDDLLMEIESVELIDGNGRSLIMAQEHIPQTETGGYLLPILEEREVQVVVRLIKRDNHLKLSTVVAKAAMIDGTFVLDLSGLEITEANALRFVNTDATVNVNYSEQTDKLTIVSSLYNYDATNGEFSMGPFLKSPNAETMKLEYSRGGWYAVEPISPEINFSFSATLEDFNSAFGATGNLVIDVTQPSTFIDDVKPGDVTITANDETKTLDIKFPEAQGDFCDVLVEVNYISEEEPEMTYYRRIELVVRPSRGGLEIPYTQKFMTPTYDDEGNVEQVDVWLDKLDRASMDMTCGRVVDGFTYETFVKQMLMEQNEYDRLETISHLISRSSKTSKTVVLPIDLGFTLNASSPVIEAGEAVQLSIQGEMIDNASFEWFVNGERIEGADQPSLNWPGAITGGEYEVSVIVTSPSVIGLPITTTVTVRGPESTMYDFILRELRSDGLGPVFNFEEQKEYGNGDENWNSIDVPNFVDLRSGVLTATAVQSPVFTFDSSGLFGTRVQSKNERDVSDVLYEVTTPGVYQVASGDSQNAYNEISMPKDSNGNAHYSCGVVAYGSASDQDYGQFNDTYFAFMQEPISNLVVYAKSKDRSVDGNIFVVAILGNHDVTTQECMYEYSNFYYGNSTLAQLPNESRDLYPVSPTFDSSLAENGITLQPEFVELTYNGLTVGLPAYGMSDLKVPMIADATYTFGYLNASDPAMPMSTDPQPLMDNSPDYEHYVVVSGISLADLGSFSLDNVKAGQNLAVTQTQDLGSSVLNLNSSYRLSGDKMLRVVTESKVESITTEPDPVLGDVKKPVYLYVDNSAAEVLVELNLQGDIPSFGAYQSGDYLIPPASSATASVLDVLNPPVTKELAVSNLQLELSSVGGAYKLSYVPSSVADVCVVYIEGQYATADSGQATRTIQLLVDGKTQTELLIPYDRPATSYFDFEKNEQVVDPAYEQPQSALALVVCGDFKDGLSYNDLLKSKLEDHRYDEIDVEPTSNMQSYISAAVLLNMD